MHPSNLLKQLPTALLVMTLSLALGACGYQLRGSQEQANLPASINLYADNQALAKATAAALAKAQVEVTVTESVATLDAESPALNTSSLRFTNTKTQRQAIIYDTNGDATDWRYQISTQMLIGSGDDSQSFRLQEYRQVALNSDSNAGSTNDRIVAKAWQDLYQALAQRAIRVLSRQP